MGRMVVGSQAVGAGRKPQCILPPLMPPPLNPKKQHSPFCTIPRLMALASAFSGCPPPAPRWPGTGAARTWGSAAQRIIRLSLSLNSCEVEC